MIRSWKFHTFPFTVCIIDVWAFQAISDPGLDHSDSHLLALTSENNVNTSLQPGIDQRSP